MTLFTPKILEYFTNNMKDYDGNYLEIGVFNGTSIASLADIYPNKKTILSILRSMNIILSRKTKFEFLAGTIFWMKGRVTRKFINLKQLKKLLPMGSMRYSAGFLWQKRKAGKYLSQVI